MKDYFINMAFTTLFVLLKSEDRIRFERVVYKLYTTIKTYFPQFDSEDYPPSA